MTKKFLITKFVCTISFLIRIPKVYLPVFPTGKNSWRISSAKITKLKNTKEKKGDSSSLVFFQLFRSAFCRWQWKSSRIATNRIPVKVLFLLEACFDLISGSSLHMKIQIMGGKITENLGFKSQQDIQKWLNTKICSFYGEFENEKKKGQKILTFRCKDLNPII